MPTHLYCLLPANNAGPGALAGIDGAAVRVLRAAGADAWVSTVTDASGPGDTPRTAVVAHDAVVAAALATGATPVPARYGQRFADDAACAAEVARRDAAIRALLARVAGLVEMAVVARLAPPDESPPLPPAPSVVRGAGAGAGRAYMERLKAGLAMERNLHLRAAAVRRRVAETVQALVDEEAMHVRSSPSAVLSISHLVPRASAAAYRDAVTSLGADPAMPSLVVVGPLAPYRFVELPGE